MKSVFGDKRQASRLDGWEATAKAQWKKEGIFKTSKLEVGNDYCCFPMETQPKFSQQKLGQECSMAKWQASLDRVIEAKLL